MLTVTADSLGGKVTSNGGRYHDLLGTRCDPYLYKLVDDRHVEETCHSSIARAIAPFHLTEFDVHDALNLFQVTGIDSEKDIYFVEPSEAQAGDFIELFAEIDVLCAFSNCRGGDLSVLGRGPQRGDSLPTCKPLFVEIYDIDAALLVGWNSPKPVDVGPVLS